MNEANKTIIWEKNIGNWYCQEADIKQLDGKIIRYCIFGIEEDGEDYCFNFLSGWGCSPDQLREEMLYAVGNYLLGYDCNVVLFNSFWWHWEQIKNNSDEDEDEDYYSLSEDDSEEE